MLIWSNINFVQTTTDTEQIVAPAILYCYSDV